LFDHSLQLDEPFERNADGEVDPTIGKRRDNLITEESAVHAYFDLSTWHSSTDGINTCQNEGFRSFGVVDIARAMKEIEYLERLGDCAE
jgi:hypothetical protein